MGLKAFIIGISLVILLTVGVILVPQSWYLPPAAPPKPSPTLLYGYIYDVHQWTDGQEELWTSYFRQNQSPLTGHVTLDCSLFDRIGMNVTFYLDDGWHIIKPSDCWYEEGP